MPSSRAAARRVTRDHIAMAIYQDRDIEAEDFDALGNFPDLSPAVASDIGWIRLKLVDPPVNDGQYRI
jgi:hypothetical protein